MKTKPIINKYIDPMVDYGFKVIFKESGNKQLLIRPLNEIFDLDIVDIEIRESEQLGLSREGHRASYDLFCQSADGSRFIIEVQLAQQEHFLERALFYTSLPIAKSMPRAPQKRRRGRKVRKDNPARRKWNYDYPPVFFLGLLNFDLQHLNPGLADPDQFVHFFTLRDEQTHELMTDRLRFAFLEVARFDKRKEECISFEDRFLYMMQNLPTFATEPDLWGDPYFTELMTEAEFANMTERQQERYIARMMRRWDYDNSMDYATKKGLEQGREEERCKNALNLKNLGVDITTISQATGLSEDQVRDL